MTRHSKIIAPESIAKNLLALPPHPEDLAWPTEHWPRDETSPATQNLADSLFDLESHQGYTYALLVIERGRLIYERYDAGANPIYMQYSWSMAKSVTHALVGILVPGRGHLAPAGA